MTLLDKQGELLNRAANIIDKQMKDHQKAIDKMNGLLERKIVTYDNKIEKLQGQIRYLQKKVFGEEKNKELS